MEKVIKFKSVNKKYVKTIPLKILQYIILAVVSVFFLFPIIVMICYSILPDGETYDAVLFSKDGIINIGTYIEILTNTDYLLYLKNSIIVGILCSFGIPVSAALCAYGFSKINFVGKKAVFSIMLATMMIPSIVTQIPLYLVYTKLHLSNTLLPLWLPSWCGGGATNIFLMTQFMKGIPNDLNNAAKIDGAGTFRIFWNMMIPLCLPIFLYVTVMAFMGSWNDFMTPLLYINNKAKYTLSLGIYFDYGKIGMSGTLPNIAMAAGAVMMLPCTVLFFVFQKYLIEGVTLSGLKG